MKYYTYIFVRQDLSPEQQVVQAAHVAMLMGVKSQRSLDAGVKEAYIPYQTGDDVSAEQTHFVVVGVRNLQALYSVGEILHKFSYACEWFFEDAIREHTAIATYPVREDLRGPLHAFNLLKLK